MAHHPLPYLNNTSVLTVYRRIRSESFLPGETITGYWVLNYDLSNMLSAFTAQMSGAGFVCLYDTRREDSLTVGNFELPQQEETEIVEKVLQAWETFQAPPAWFAEWSERGVLLPHRGGLSPGRCASYCVPGPAARMQALDGVVRSVNRPRCWSVAWRWRASTFVPVSCVTAECGRGLRKIFDALRSRQGEQRAAEDPQRKHRQRDPVAADFEQRRGFGGAAGTGGVQAGIEGRAGRPVWPCADQLSVFLPQHAGFHLLVQRKPDGCGQQRIGHDRRPVRDPEICAGFLGLVHLPSRGGGMHAALYRDPANAQEHTYSMWNGTYRTSCTTRAYAS